MKDIIATARVIAKPLPFSEETLQTTVGAGMSLREILGNDSDRYIININGEVIFHTEWELTFVKEDDLVLIFRLPGDSGRDVLRIFAVLAVLVFAAWAGPLIAGWAVAGSPAFWSSALMFLGVVAVGLLLPPILDGASGGERKRLNSLTGSRNQFAPFGTIPILYGKHRLYPPIAAVPYTEVIGEDQYLNMIFCIGLGDYDIDDSLVKIGDTLATEFEDVTIAYTDLPDQPDIFELQHNLVLNQDTDNPGDTFTRTTQANTSEFSLDFVLPGGLIQINDEGDEKSVQIHFQIEWRASGSADPWTNISAVNWHRHTRGERQVGGLNANDFPVPVDVSHGSVLVSTASASWLMVSGKTRDPYRVGIRVDTGSSNTWDIRVTRQRTSFGGIADYRFSTDPNWFQFAATFVWTATRSISMVQAIQLPANTATFLTLRVRATDQLNGIIDTLNVVATRKLRKWNGATFDTPVATRDPAWAFLDILTGLGNARPITSESTYIWLDDLQDWATENAAEGRFYDEPIDYNTSVFDALTRVAGVGRGALSTRDGKWTIILELSSPAPVQYFTPRNSWGFSSTKRFVEFPHAFNVRFNSEDSDYQEDEVVVYDDGFNVGNATEFEVLELRGITDADQAWKTGRYTMASIRLRPEIYSFSADVEHIIAQRGDHILMSHDIPLWGNSYGRVTTIAGNVITTDEAVDLDGGTNYVIRVRRDDGTDVIEDLTAQGGTDIFTHTFTPSIPAGIKVGDLYMLGELGSETQQLVIVSIEPSTDLTARVTCVDHNPAILTSDTGVIPPFSPNITLPADPTQLSPASPFNVTARSDQNTFAVDGAGVLIPRITVTWDLVSDVTQRFPGLTAELRYREWHATEAPSTWNYIKSDNAFQSFIEIPNVQLGNDYTIQLRVTTQYGVSSIWTSEIIHTVGGATRIPAAIDNLTAIGVAGGVILDVDLTTLILRVGSYVEIVFGTVNDRDDVGAEVIQVVIPADLNASNLFKYFIAIDDETERFFWARLVDIYLTPSEWFPVSATAGVAATPFGSSSIAYYIKPTEGTAIRNGTGQLTVEAHKIDGGTDILLATGTIKLFDPGNNEITVANGYQTGSDGYTGILNATNITNSIVITMKDGVGGTVLDTITLVDIADGGVGGFIEPENGLAWRRESIDGAWTPAQLTTDLDCTFVNNGGDVARQSYRLTLDPDTVTITGALTTHPLGDLNTGDITITPSGSGTSTFSVKFDYANGGDVFSVSETVHAVTGGATGQPGQTIALIYDDLDTTTLAAGQSRYAMLTARGTDTSGSQNNFASTDGILINRRDKAGTTFSLFYSDIRLGDRIVYWISVTRWFVFEVDETFDVVGSGNAEAYKFGVTLIQSLDPDPTVNIPTAAGTDIEFQINQSPTVDGNVLLDPDLDLSTAVGEFSSIGQASYWNYTGHWVTIRNFTSPSTLPTFPNWGWTFNLGTGPNNSNTITMANSIPAISGFTEGWLIARRRIRTNTPSFDVKLRIANTSAVGKDIRLQIEFRGYSTTRSGTAQSTISKDIIVSRTDGTTYDDFEVHVEGSSDVDAQYWEFRVGWWTTSAIDTGTLIIDSLFVFPTPRSFGANTFVDGGSPNNDKYHAGLVPESDATDDVGKVLRADGTWIVQTGGGGSPITDGTINNTALKWDTSGIAWIENVNILLDPTGSIYTKELAAAPIDIATFGQYWTRNDNTPMWTGDDGVDRTLLGTGGALPTSSEFDTLRGNNTGGWIEESRIQITGSGELKVTNTGDTASINLSHDGTDLNIVSISTTDFNFFDGVAIKAWDTADGRWIGFNNDGQRGIISTGGVGTNDLRFEIDASGIIEIRGGTPLRLTDSAGTNYLQMDANANDVTFAFTSITDWNITGLTGGIVLGSAVEFTFPTVGVINGDDLLVQLEGATREFRLASLTSGVEFQIGTIASPSSNFLVTPATFTYNTNTIWHAGNDGDGSGLDADTVGTIANSNLMIFTGAQVPNIADLDDVQAHVSLATDDILRYNGTNWANFAFPLVSQVIAEAGTDVAVKGWSALRVKQAIDALGGGGGGTDINPVDDSADTTLYPVMVSTATGIQGTKTDASAFVFNAATGRLSVPGLTINTVSSTFAGSITFNGTGARIITGGNLRWNDNIEAMFGSGNDARIYFSGVDLFIDVTNAASDFRVRLNSTENAIVAIVNSSVTLYHNGNAKLATASDGIDVTGDVGGTTIGGITQANLVDKTAAENISNNWEWQDNNQIRLGTGADVRMYHTGVDSFFDVVGASNSLWIRVNTTESAAVFRPNDSVDLYFNNAVVTRTLAAASGGLEINNTSTGAGFERVLTTSDISAGGNVSNVATPVNNQLAIWTTATTIEGHIDLLWNGTDLQIDADSKGIVFGEGQDFRIDWTGTVARLESNASLEILVNVTETAIQCSANAAVTLYYNTNAGLRTQQYNGTDNITGAEVRHWDGSWYDVGLARMPEVTFSANLVVSDTHWHKSLVQTGGTTRTLTFNTDTTQPQGVVMWVKARGGAVTLVDGTMALSWYNGTGSISVGNLSLAQGGWATVTKTGDSTADVVGVGLS